MNKLRGYLIIVYETPVRHVEYVVRIGIDIQVETVSWRLLL